MSDIVSSGDYFAGNISATDSLVQILTPIFGTGWEKVGINAVLGGGSDSATMIIAVLGAINTVALSAGALLLGWVTLSATMGTAHEGQFLGKRFHDFWMPLRSGLAITFLAPVAKGGLCVVQVIGLIMIGYSIKFANYIGNVGLDYMLKNKGSFISLSTPPGLKENGRELAAGLLKTLVIQHHYQLNQRKDFKFYDIDTTLGYSFSFYGPNRLFGLKRALSYVVITRPNTPSDIGTKRAVAVQEMYHSLSPLALAIVTNSTAEYENRTLDPTIFEKSINKYVATMATEINQMLSQEEPEYHKELETFVKQAKKEGVLWLGSYYHTISRFAGKVHEITYDSPKFYAQNISGISDDMNVLLASALERVQNIEEQLDERIKIAESGNNSGMWRYITPYTNALTKKGINGFINAITDGDPLANLANWGHGLMAAGETVLSLYYTAYLASNTADGVANSGLGKLVSVIPGAQLITGGINGAAKFVGKLGSLVLILALSVISLGLMLGVYLPLVPFIVWMSAIVSTIILWVEFLVHMPIWAITFAVGEGEGLAGQRSQHGLLLIANAVLRLPLMTAGFLIAVVIMSMIGKVIGATLAVAAAGMISEHVVGIPTMIAIWFLFGGFTILQTHAIFGLVTHLTEGAMKFLGGGVTSMGEAQHEARTRAMIMASLTKGEQATQAGMAKSTPDMGNLSGQQANNNMLTQNSNARQSKGDLTPGEIK